MAIGFSVTWPSRLRAAPVTATLIMLACGGDATGLDPDDLAGTWIASEAVLTNPANPAQSVDVVALGAPVSLEFKRDGTISAVFGPDSDDGTYSVTAGEITLFLGGTRSHGTIDRQGDRLRIELTEGVSWDFEDTGISVPVILTLTLMRAVS